MDLSLTFLLKKFFSTLIQPPLSPWLVVLIGLSLCRRHKRLAMALISGAIVLAWFFSTRLTVNWLAEPLESIPPIRGESLRSAQAIVILGAGQRRWLPEYGGPTPNWLGLERLRYGARLARASGLPVLITGGAPSGETPESITMARTLEEDFGIRVRWLEERALDTADNAQRSAEILLPQGIRRVVLVTHAAHMPRAMREFAAVGFVVTPAPMGYLSHQGGEGEIFDYLPTASASYAGWIVTHEWLGLMAQKLRQALFAAKFFE